LTVAAVRSSHGAISLYWYFMMSIVRSTGLRAIGPLKLEFVFGLELSE
jgi:hypothetical protein